MATTPEYDLPQPRPVPVPDAEDSRRRPFEEYRSARFRFEREPTREQFEAMVEAADRLARALGYTADQRLSLDTQLDELETMVQDANLRAARQMFRKQQTDDLPDRDTDL